MFYVGSYFSAGGPGFTLRAVGGQGNLLSSIILGAVIVERNVRAGLKSKESGDKNG